MEIKGSCTASAGYVRLNTDLVMKPPECLKYILVHELAHLLEPTHNARFAGLTQCGSNGLENHKT
ncbi:MAG TPA: M48 family metallopeptidase [Roseateles sp.]